MKQCDNCNGHIKSHISISHINSENIPKNHLFCSKQCKHEWITKTIKKNRILKLK